MLTNGAFTALILICGHFSDAVPPPANVTVKCRNLQTIVSWDYSEDQPQTIFRVKLNGHRDIEPIEVNTTGHQYDLSQFVFDSKERWLFFLTVFVTAVQGDEQSVAVASNSFSFDRLNPVDLKCSLDFPPVKVLKGEKGASVEFTNPLHFYDELKRTIAPNRKPVLRYSVSSSANTFNQCCASDFTCKSDVTLSAEECVTLKGVLLLEAVVKQIAFKETKKYCSEKQEVDELVMFAIILGSIFLIVIIVAVAVVCKVEAWTMKIPIPSIRVNSHGNGEQQSFFIPPVNEKNSLVSIVSPPVETTSLVSEDENFCEQPNDGAGDYECRAEGNYADGGCLEESLLGANGTDEDSPDGSVKTECISLSSTEEESSPYDRPHVHFQRDLGDGEPVTGYGGN